MNWCDAKTIIVAEDNLESRSYLEIALQTQGYQVRLAENGNEALQCLQEEGNAASLVLMDVMMPGMDGIEALHSIRRWHADLPVILISDTAGHPSLNRVVESGSSLNSG